jgi:HD-like signal output (HDOD) protein
MSSDPAAVITAFLAKGSLPLSRSLSRVQGMLQRADYNAADLADHLRMDATLAAKVMAVANSAFFSRQPCASIDDAVNRLGTAQLTRIFSQVLAGAALMTPLQAYALSADAIWRRSVTTAVGAELAARRSDGDGSTSYMVGLLHQIGMLVVNRLWLQKPGATPITRGEFTVEYTIGEKILCGFDQAALGAELLRQLSFPEDICRLIGRQYQPPLESAAHVLYLGRVARAIICDQATPATYRDVLQHFKITSNSQLEAFSAEVREETQARIQSG